MFNGMQIVTPNASAIRIIFVETNCQLAFDIWWRGYNYRICKIAEIEISRWNHNSGKNADIVI